MRAVAVWAAVKTVYYFAENLRHLQEATSTDLAYHKFVLLLAYNMAQITVSFAIDFYCLVRIDRGSLSGVDPSLQGAELMFECFYFSVLNFSFFGYGDITPAHVPGKVMGSLGGAQDLAMCAKRLLVVMTHTAKDGAPKVVTRCTMPLTAPRCVDRIITDVAVMDVEDGSIVLRECAPGWDPEQIQAITEAPLTVAADVREITLA